MNQLPEPFLQTMKQLLTAAGRGKEYSAFLESYSELPYRGLRRNRLKIADENHFMDFLDRLFMQEFSISARDALAPVAWSDDGYELTIDLTPGKSLAARLGLFYIQEPSAMLPAQVLGTKPGERVADLCAAPGGKSARIAADLAGQGLLLSNDVSSSRGRILVRNLEQLGVSNAVVTAAEPAGLATLLPDYFDRVLVDAPCSGEGMFRRDPKAAQSWSDFGPDSIISIQNEILDAAVQLLKPGGQLVYSTCTFNRRENEEQILALMKRHPEMEILPVRKVLPAAVDLDPGIRLPGDEADVSLAARIWPWRNRGEGHFCCLLQKSADVSDPSRNQLESRNRPEPRRVPLTAEDKKIASDFYESLLLPARWKELERRFRVDMAASADSSSKIQMNRLHLLPASDLRLPGIHILKEGWYLGNLIQGRKEKRFEPAHASIGCFGQKSFRPECSLDLPIDDNRIQRLLKGETLSLTSEELERLQPSLKSPARGYIAVLVEGLPLSWAKLDGSGMLKNLYPAGWRIS